MPTKRLYQLNQSPLFKLGSRSKLAKLLGMTPGALRALAAGDGLYKEFEVEKKSGGKRGVENPCRPLKLAQATLARLLGRIQPPDFLFCPVKRRCYVTNAAAHRHSRMVQCLDIKKFFPSVSQRRVFWFFATVMKCPRDVAGLLAQLACYKGHLPTGSPLSPIMAYFAYYDLWAAIDALCKARGYTFTVYIDDVTISGTHVPKSAIWEVQQMIHGAGLRYHKQKTFVDKPAEITGIILKDGQLLAPFRQHRKLKDTRAALRAADPVDRKALKSRLTGVTAQIGQIERQNLCAPQRKGGSTKIYRLSEV
ncbi:reverse transcriptase (RNA-dependent DNA polymerase) [Sphingomonas faeni]|uniref:Reverse transcriptase (RNA-dependent DNA polymerase) n=1 Tax=Sphingomonas faeni TaxID=185950 RepID=A0A2T5UCH6_9SPHN|nr:reverse transcriptase family protein [Sphingomonas faeni]PTW49200.1 reverse transcriptase (RNA-dependent DNA polymerase) [Sphingomonas faeni]